MIDAPEFSFRLRPEDLLAEPREVVLAADETQRNRLAIRFDLVQLDKLDATVVAHRRENGDVLVVGSLDAAVTQRCVVTLEPVENRVQADFRRLYVADHEQAIGLSEDEDWEPLPALLDIGELVAQEFGLALDPFPRAPGASLDQQTSAEPAESPFAILQRMKP